MIYTVSDSDMASLCTAMNAAFADYHVTMKLSEKAFCFMMRMRGFRPEYSRMVIAEGHIGAFWLIGVRDQRAYLISSGTLPAHRRKGLSKKIGLAVIEYLKARGVESLQTEVLNNNTSARALYSAFEFKQVRDLESYTLGMPQKTSTLQADIGCADIPPRTIACQLWDSAPSWQNDTASLCAVKKDVITFAIRDANGLAAYASFVPGNASLAQIAVRRDRRRCGIASALLRHGQDRLGLQSLRVINVDRAMLSLSSFLNARGAETDVAQKELVLNL